MSLLDNLTPEDLDADQRELADCIGIEAYRKLITTYAGSSLNIRMPDRITLKLRNENIKKDFNGYNFLELAKKYNLCESSIRKIVFDKIQEERTKPIENQISFFN